MNHEADLITEAMIKQYVASLRLAAKYNALLHPEQQRIGAGDPFLMLTSLITRSTGPAFLTWGLVIDDLTVSYTDVEGTTHQQRMESLASLVDLHILLAHLHRPGPDQMPAITHAVTCWPITPEVFAAGMDAGWDVTRLDPTTRAHISIAIQAWDGHMRSIGQAAL